MGWFLIEEAADAASVRWAGRVVVNEVLPGEVRELPEDLAALDLLLRDARLLAPIASCWCVQAVSHSRPTISMETYVRLMVVKQRTGWVYETLVREVSDSLHLRRFCLIALGEQVPHESTVRKLTRRLGGEAVEGIDSTGVEADVRYPTDSGLALDSARVLAREARKVCARVGRDAGWVQDRSRAIGRRVRLMSRTLSRRTGERKRLVLDLTAQAGKLVTRSVSEARRLAALARRRSRGRRARAKLRQIERLEQFIERAERVVGQIEQRMRGERIGDRLVSIFDPDARPIRKGKLGKPNEFGYVAQLCEVTENTKRGARGFILPASTKLGNPQENPLLERTIEELQALGLRPAEVALDGGFQPRPTSETLDSLGVNRRSSLARSNQARAALSAEWRATAPAWRVASATSSAATDYADLA
jgi:transposase, IS5 family